MTTLADIECSECGSSEPPWIGSIADLGGDLNALLNLDSSGVLQVERSGNQVQITGRDRVGLLLLPSGRKVRIRSKVPSLIILEWLAFLGEFPPLEAWLNQTAINVGKDFRFGKDLPACIGRLFIHEVETVTRRFLRKDFLPVRISSSTVRGRLVTSALYRETHRLPSVPQLARTRTIDTVYNSVIALALDRTPLLLPHALRGDVARLRDSWAHVSREINDVVSAVTEAQWACPPGYRNAIQLARLILIGATIDPASGAGGEIFSLSLAGVWEKSLRRLFEQLQGTTGWKVVADLERTRKWDDAEGKEDDKRWMTADILAERANYRWIIDAKYKLGFRNESRNDRFQMCAYAVGFSAQRATLAYPTGKNVVPLPRLLLNTNFFGRPVRIDAIELPMEKGPEACRHAIQSLCGEQK